jgi:hypothetical protein
MLIVFFSSLDLEIRFFSKIGFLKPRVIVRNQVYSKNWVSDENFQN